MKGNKILLEAPEELNATRYKYNASLVKFRVIPGRDNLSRIKENNIYYGKLETNQFNSISDPLLYYVCHYDDNSVGIGELNSSEYKVIEVLEKFEKEVRILKKELDDFSIFNLGFKNRLINEEFARPRYLLKIYENFPFYSFKLHKLITKDNLNI